jgi:hypothetical protein
MAPPNRFEPSYHPYHSDDDDFHEKEYENDPSYDEEEHDSRRHGRHQNDDHYSSTQNSNNTCVSSNEEDDLYPPYPQVEDKNMIVVSAAPEFLPLRPKMKMPKQAKFNVLPPNKTSKKKPELIADISDARDKYQTMYESLAKAVHEREVLRERLDRAQKLAIKNHNENESNAKSLRVALKSKESFKLKHVSTKKALDDTNEKVSVLKKSNTSLQKTIKTLASIPD